MSFFRLLEMATANSLEHISTEYSYRRHTNNVRDQEYKVSKKQEFLFLDEIELVIDTDWSSGKVKFLEPCEESFELRNFMERFDVLNDRMIESAPSTYEPPHERILDDEVEIDFDEETKVPEFFDMNELAHY